jgi:CBS domain-containing protein
MKTQKISTEVYAETLRDLIGDRVVLKFSAKETVPEIMQRMRRSGIDAGGVVNADGTLAGLVTKNGILRYLYCRVEEPSALHNLQTAKSMKRLTARDVMIAHPDTLHIDDSVEDALDIMTYFSHRYMPVIDNAGKLAAIVDTRELRRSLERKYGALKSIDDPVSLFMIQQKLHDMNLAHSHAY